MGGRVRIGNSGKAVGNSKGLPENQNAEPPAMTHLGSWVLHTVRSSKRVLCVSTGFGEPTALGQQLL